MKTKELCEDIGVHEINAIARVVLEAFDAIDTEEGREKLGGGGSYTDIHNYLTDKMEDIKAKAKEKTNTFYKEAEEKRGSDLSPMASWCNEVVDLASKEFISMAFHEAGFETMTRAIPGMIALYVGKFEKVILGLILNIKETPEEAKVRFKEGLVANYVAYIKKNEEELPRNKADSYRHTCEFLSEVTGRMPVWRIVSLVIDKSELLGPFDKIKAGTLKYLFDNPMMTANDVLAAQVKSTTS